ncbi:MAG: glycosyltransferase family 39 protein [Phycisphaerales bacterium]|nr:glycosyltransferase family 39 protein [Phycisphaerales bacterium]
MPGAIAIASQPPAEPGANTSNAWPRFPSRKQLTLTLTAITLLAAFLRFFRISYQCYWTDESYTVNRVQGNFQQMLASLSNQGFPPGWYALLRWWTLFIEYFVSPDHWWTKILGSAANPAYTALTPLATRSLTAILGTLTVLAVYFLARQFTDRRGALLAALLTAVNPYLIYYSRDIKMYGPMWLFLILNAALFFKWQTTHKHLLWFPLYVLTGFVMTAMHSTAWFMIALQLIFLLTRPRLRCLDGPLFALAAGIMSLLPIYWYLNGTYWWDRLIERRGDTTLSWVLSYTDMTWKTIASLPCSHLLGYLYPSYPPDPMVRTWFNLGNSDFNLHAATRSMPWLAVAEFYVALIFAAILILGLIPWRGRRRSLSPSPPLPFSPSWWLALWILLPPAALALTWIPRDSTWYKVVWQSYDKISPLWEPRYVGAIIAPLILWLAASLRRLPTWPVRTLAISFVIAASLASACSNYFVYRNPPFHIAAQIATKPDYFDAKNRKTLAVAHLNLTIPGVVIPVTYALARHVRPMSDGSYFLPEQNFAYGMYEIARLHDFLRRTRTTPEIHTIIITDKCGDLTPATESLSTESLSLKLGPNWKLVEEKSYRLYFEWRFYVYNTWRTRVWQRIPPPAPSSVPGFAGGASSG